ncbi:MAG: hypothetical protein C4294_19565 [Nitrospiraceae bacterium]
MKRRSIRFLFASAGLLILFVSVSVGITYAFAAYHGNWSEQAGWGSHQWYNYDWGVLEWYVADWWSDGQANSLKSNHGFPWFNEYQIEQEAYNPGAGASCDRLVIAGFDTMDLPTTGWQQENGCGDPNFKEEAKIFLNEDAIQANRWIFHKMTYQERNRCSGGDGEVNYSFSHNHTWSDSWLGKIVYNACFSYQSSDPNNLVDYY